MIRVAILGGGLMGRLMAWRLAKLNASLAISLFDKGSREGEHSAAHIAAAMLAPLAESIEATPLVVQLGKHSLSMWQDIVPQLPTSVFMQQKGSLVVWHGQDKPLAQQFSQHLQRVAGETAQVWQAAELAQHEPQLAGRFHQAYFLPDEGQLDNRQVLHALASALEQEQVECYWQHTVERADLAQTFDWIIDCRGFGAQATWHQAAASSRLRGIRGEVARVLAPEVHLNRPIRLLHPRYPLYIAPKENHVFVIGATQLESENTAPVSVRSGLELLSALYAVHPAFGEAHILELASQLRPTLHHHNPEIRFHRHQRVIEINGLFRHGFMIAPAVSMAATRLAFALFYGTSHPHYDAETGMAFVEINHAASYSL